MPVSTTTVTVKNATSLLSRLGYDCDLCLHGGKCQELSTGLAEPHCICRSGYEGKRCEEKEIRFSSGGKKMQNPEAVAGIVVGVFVMIIIIVIAIITWRRFKKVKKDKNRRLSLRESFQKKMSIEGISVADDRAHQKKYMDNNSIPPPYPGTPPKKTSSGDIYSINAEGEENKKFQSRLSMKSLEKWPQTCHINPSAVTEDESSHRR